MYSLVFSTPVFLPGKSHGQKSQLVSLHGIVKSDTTEEQPTYPTTPGLPTTIALGKNLIFCSV